MTDLDRTTRPEDDAGLDALFALARGSEPAPVPVLSDDLMARILADAAIVDQDRHRRSGHAAGPVRGGGWQAIVAALGGWPAMGGLAAATVAGLWIGVAPPSGLSGLTDAVWGNSVPVAVFSVDDVLGSEG